MKFTYAYKTSDGVRHEDVIDAPSREVVFSTLRERGIKAIKVVAADGSKANGAPHRRSRTPYVIAGVAILLALLSSIFALRPSVTPMWRNNRELPQRGRQKGANLPAPRHQLSAPLNMDDLPFAHPSEQFLARFAQPATPMAEVSEADLAVLSADLSEALKTDITILPDDPAVMVELKRIVVGLKQEARLIIESGRTGLEALRYFMDRQRMEVEHRKRLMERVVAGELPKAEANSMFRTMGFREIDN